MSSQTNIRNAIFDQRSTQPPEVGVSRWHRQTDKHTHGHGDSMTNLAQWGRVGENNRYSSELGTTKFLVFPFLKLNGITLGLKFDNSLLMAKSYLRK